MKTFTTDDFDYELDESLIAKYPNKERASSRLLQVDRQNTAITHGNFKDILEFVTPNDLLVLNDTRVIPARLFGEKGTGGKIECLVERVLSDNRLLAHIKASKAPKPGTEIILADGKIKATVIARADDLFELEISNEQPVIELLEAYGEMPLPPYIDRIPEELDDERYQTVFARERGAVAAPTAGLHFSEEILDEIKARGTDIAYVTLHVGAGTFQPVRVDNIHEHKMHSEWMQVNAKLCDAVKNCQLRGGRVIAVGTTVVRCLETAAQSGEIKPYSGETDIFIYPGFEFHAIDALITNFHLPKSTLLMLVSAFAGYDLMREAYQQAVAERYRFFSYGDAMLIS